jgi:oligopeptide transport system ATP-binding protein
MSESSGPVLQVEGLQKVFTSSRGVGSRRTTRELEAVSDVSFELQRGGSLGIVGESGSGKTTIAKMLMGIETPTAGRIVLDGVELVAPSGSKGQRTRARLIQMVFQDPYTSLDPRQSVGAGIDEIQRVHFDRTQAERAERVTEVLEAVGLGERHAQSVPRKLSGGQRQRVAIARAIATEPRVLILDEAVSALDVSVQAQILNLLASLRKSLDLSYLMISHDLAVVRQVSDECLVMFRGRIVERADVSEVLVEPRHPYTQRLIASVPRPNMTLKVRTDDAEPPVTTGCLFRSQCPAAHERCIEEPPAFLVRPHHEARCWTCAPDAGERERAQQAASVADAGL